jgi:hypothetical protein
MLRPNPLSKKEQEEITGKYLFFSSDRSRLLEVAREELLEHGFPYAKVPLEGHRIGEEWVLCLYFKDDSRKLELEKRYPPSSGVRYRYWKSDEATLAGQYSEKFLKATRASRGRAHTETRAKRGDNRT